MKLKFKENRKTYTFEITKRNVKIYKIGKDYKLVEYNLGEREQIFPFASELVYYAEFYNSVLEHINLLGKVEIVE